MMILIMISFFNRLKIDTSKGGHGAGQGGYWPFPQPASHSVDLKIPTCHPSKISNSRVGLGMAGQVE
jgi:hypothetical protein